MGKYYVKSGEAQEIIDSAHELDAVCDMLLKCDDNTRLGSVIWVNEQGFDDIDHETDMFIETESFLDMLGIGYET